MVVESIGIDFGTSNTTVTILYQHEQGNQFLDLSHKQERIPYSSVVATPKDGKGPLIFGKPVREHREALAKTHHIYLSMKSYLGTEKDFLYGDTSYTATQVVAQFLAYIKEDVYQEYQVGISQATFSYPVDFPPEARRELKHAAIDAGIQPMGFLNEATAVYLDNLETCKLLSRVLVLDWGAGTLDSSILQVDGNRVEELSVTGTKIGGDDLDLHLAQAFHNQLALEYSLDCSYEDMSEAERDMILSYCEQAKIEFSHYQDDYEELMGPYGCIPGKDLPISYDFFENIAINLIRTKVFPVINNALQQGNVRKEELDGVIIVGGSSQIKAFEHAMCHFFGEEKIIVPQEMQWTVARGAALAGTLAASFRLSSPISLLMSDNTSYPLFRKEVDGVGSSFQSLYFDLVEDSQEAKFIFVDQENRSYSRCSVATKGFFREKLSLTGYLSPEQIAVITIKSVAMSDGEEFQVVVELTNLRFYYYLPLEK